MRANMTEEVERFLLGSVSHKVSHHAPCSVLIVRESRAVDGGRPAERTGAASG